MTDRRRVEAVLPAQAVIDDGDMRLWRALPAPARTSLGPFVFLDHYRHRSRRGIGDRPHPHAGIEVLSYLLEGAMQHRDSLGFADRIGAGDAQCIRAGRGMLHAEQPEGGRHGLQLWTRLPPSLERAEPSYRRVPAREIPWTTAGEARVGVLAGRLQGLDGPLALARPTTLAHVRLPAGTAASLATMPQDELGVYVLQGRVAIDDGAPQGPGGLVVLGPGAELHLACATDDTDLVVLGGQRLDEPVLFGGPFVMGTPEGLRQARQDFLEGRMGTLDGVPF